MKATTTRGATTTKGKWSKSPKNDQSDVFHRPKQRGANVRLFFSSFFFFFFFCKWRRSEPINTNKSKY